MAQPNDTVWNGVDRRDSGIPVHDTSPMPKTVTIEMVYGLLRDHIKQEREWRDDISKAFPVDRHGEPDYSGHGDYHTKLIDRAAKAEGAKERLIEKVAGGSIWALLIFIGTAALAYLKDHILK